MKEELMSDFNFHWKQEKKLLTNRKYLSTDCRQALHLIVRLCEKGQKLEAENADLRLKVEELGALCKRKTRQCCHKDRIISSLDLELAALRRELAGEKEKY